MDFSTAHMKLQVNFLANNVALIFSHCLLNSVRCKWCSALVGMLNITSEDRWFEVYTLDPLRQETLFHVDSPPSQLQDASNSAYFHVFGMTLEPCSSLNNYLFGLLSINKQQPCRMIFEKYFTAHLLLCSLCFFICLT